MKKEQKTSDRIISKLHKLGFHWVTKVKDADEPIWVKVTKGDTTTGKQRDHTECALARACVREKNADGAVINVGTSYIINGNVATRYLTSVGVGREITSFDRGSGFEPGEDYLLAAVSPASRMDAKDRHGPLNGGAGKPRSGRTAVHRHTTENIRVNRVNRRAKKAK